jgi:hypothetical protein
MVWLGDKVWRSGKTVRHAFWLNIGPRIESSNPSDDVSWPFGSLHPPKEQAFVNAKRYKS